MARSTERSPTLKKAATASKIVHGVDTRADGGYIIWWPATGLPVLFEAAPAPWPDWLLEHFQPKPRLVTSSNFEPVFTYGDAWPRGLVRTVVNAGIGERNSVLFWAACRAGEAVRDGKADETFITDVLVEAATRAGLPEREAQRTVQSGMNRHG